MKLHQKEETWGWNCGQKAGIVSIIVRGLDVPLAVGNIHVSYVQTRIPVLIARQALDVPGMDVGRNPMIARLGREPELRM